MGRFGWILLGDSRAFGVLFLCIRTAGRGALTLSGYSGVAG